MGYATSLWRDRFLFFPGKAALREAARPAGELPAGVARRGAPANRLTAYPPIIRIHSFAIGQEAHAVFQLDVGTDYTIRTDLDAVTNARTVCDARHRINRHILPDPTDLLLDYRRCASCGRPSAA